MISTSVFLSTMVGIGVVTALLIVLIVLLIVSIQRTGIRDNVVHIVFAAITFVLYGMLLFGKFHLYEGEVTNKAIVTTNVVCATDKIHDNREVKYYVQIEDYGDFVEVSKEQYNDLEIGENFSYRLALVECERF